MATIKIELEKCNSTTVLTWWIYVHVMYIYMSDVALPAGALAQGDNPFTHVMTGRGHLHQLRHQELHTATREAMLLILVMTDHVYGSFLFQH